MKLILNLKVVSILLLLFIQAAAVRAQQANDALVSALVSEELPTQAQASAKIATGEETTSSKDLEKPHEKKAETTQKPKGLFPTVPTTKVLAIGRFTAPPTPEQIKEFFPREVPDTLRLYLAGKIDQWWVRQDQTGAVFLMNVTSAEEARALLEKLPLGVAKLMVFDYIELGPLSPLYRLLSEG